MPQSVFVATIDEWFQIEWKKQKINQLVFSDQRYYIYR